jgi:hypothetical protein
MLNSQTEVTDLSWSFLISGSVRIAYISLR